MPRRLPAVDPLLAHPRRGVCRGHRVEPGLAQLALEPARADRQHAPDPGHLVAHVEGARARGRDDAIRPDRRPVAREPRQVVAVVVHRVVGDVHDVVAAAPPGRRARDRRRGRPRRRGRRRHRDRRGGARRDATVWPCPRTPPPRSGPPPGAPGRRPRRPSTGRRGCWSTAPTCCTGSGGSGRAPPAAVIGRLRAAVPGTVTIDLVFDGVGHGVFGRVAQRMTVRYSGRRTGRRRDPRPDVRGGDGGRRGQGGRRGRARGDERSRAARAAPRQGRPDGPAPVAHLAAWTSPSWPRDPSGNRRPPSMGAGRAPGAPNDDGADDRPGWKPGRGATTKTGPARKVARHKRHPRHPA